MFSKQFLIVTCPWLGEVILGFSLGWTSPILPKLQDILETPLDNVVTDVQGSWISSVIYIGTILASCLLGNLPNVIGRKRTLQIGSAVSFVAYVMMTFAINVPMLIVFRLLAGFGLCIIKINNIIYISEISSTKYRGTFLTCSDIFPALGTLLVYSTAPFIPYAYTGYIALTLCTIHFVGLCFIPESPSYYLMKMDASVSDQIEQAQQTLKFLGRDDDFDTIKSSHKDDSEEKGQKDYSKWKELLQHKGNRKSLFVAVSLVCFQQLSGVVVLNFYATSIFELAGSSLDSDIASILIAVVNVCATPISPLCIERLGRRPLLIISTSAISAILVSTLISLTESVILGSYFYLDFVSNPFVEKVRLVPVICLASFYIFYCLGLSIIPGVLIGEMFTPRVRSLGASVAYVICFSLGFGVTTAFGYVITMTGGHVPFWFFSATCTCACIFSVLFVPETKGKSLEEIQAMLNR